MKLYIQFDETLMNTPARTTEIWDTIVKLGKDGLCKVYEYEGTKAYYATSNLSGMVVSAINSSHWTWEPPEVYPEYLLITAQEYLYGLFDYTK